MKRVALVTALGLFALGGIFSETVVPRDGWQVRESAPETPSYPQTGSLEGYTPFGGGNIPRSLSLPLRKVSFVRDVSLQPAADGRSAALLVGPSDYPVDFYLNGTLIGRIGHYRDYYSSTVYHASRFIIDNSLITGHDRLTAEAVAKYEVSALPVMKLGDWSAFGEEVFWRNLLNVSLMQASMAFSLVLAAFFAFLYLIGSRDRKYLWFVLICASFALAYINMSLFRDSRGTLTIDKLSRWGLPLTSLFLFFFVWEISGFRVGNAVARRIGAAIPSVLVAVSVALTAVGRDKESVYQPFAAYTTGLVLPVLLLATVAVLAVSVFRRRKPDTIGALVGIAAIVGTSVHDLVVFRAGGIPFMWLVPYGYMGFVLSIFFILALDQTAVLKKTRRQARIMEAQHEGLSTVVAELMGVSDGLVTSSNSLSATMGETLATLEAYGEENRALTETFGEQARSMEAQIEKISARLMTSASRIPEAIANQARSAKEVTASLAELGRSVGGSLASVEQSSGFINALASDADASRRTVDGSREALSRVEATSERVRGILAAIAELSEQTNVLSINAAIESARYGAAGKGFAVIAGEIRKFAGQSQENVRVTVTGVQEMSEAIAVTIRTHDEVRRALDDIIAKSHEAASQANEVSSLVRAQEAESRAMGESAGRMSRETDVMEVLSREEREQTESLRVSLGEIAANFAEIGERLESQSGMRERVSLAIDRMRAMMEGNAGQIELLKGSIARAREADAQDFAD